jgi:type I restriction-modification system DNA methylase subunit
MDITNSDDLREKIHEIHNYMRNNGIGYGLTSLKVFNLFYGLMKIEEYGLNEKIGLNNETCKFSYLLKLVNEPNKKDDLISILYNETLEYIFNNENIKVLLGYNIPLDLKTSVYKYLINEINLIKDIEKSTKEQLSGKIYEYFVGRDQSAISELGAYFTNRGIVDFILNKIKPQLKPDGTIPKMIDMFGGSGGFTIGYMDYLIKNKFEIDWKSQLDNIYHFDINEDVLKSARLELFCLSEGIFPNINNVKRTNSFKEDFRDIGKFDIIMTNPPYGGDKIGTSAKKEKRDKIIKYIDNEIDIFKKYIIQKIESIDNKKKLLEEIKKPKTNIDKIVSLIKNINI